MRHAKLPIIPSDVLAELREVTEDVTLQQRDMMEWGKKRPKRIWGEIIFWLPKLKVYVAVRRAK